MEVPDDYIYPKETNLPFYINLYLDGTFPGHTSGVTRPVNSWCVEHNNSNNESWQVLCENYRLEHPEEFEEEEESEEEQEWELLFLTTAKNFWQ